MEGAGRVAVGAQPRADANGLEVAGVDGAGDDVGIDVHLHDGLGHRGLQEIYGGVGQVYAELAETCAQGGTCAEDGSAHHAAMPGHEKGVAHRALVCETWAAAQQVLHLGLLGDPQVALDAVDAFIAEADVQEGDVSHEALVLGEEEGQLGHPQGEGRMRAY